MANQVKTEAHKEDAEKDWMTVKLSKAITYQEIEVKEINLKKMEDLTAQDMNNIYDLYYALGGNKQIMQESTLLFAQILASQTTWYPMEVFERMSAKDAMRLKNRVYRFFFLEA